MAVLLTQYRQGFQNGYTEITQWDEPEDNAGIQFSIFKQSAGEFHVQVTSHETAWLLLKGAANILINEETVSFKRYSIFDESASCLHVPAHTHLRFNALTDTEYLVFSVPNSKNFPTGVYFPQDVRTEQRGKGIVGDTAERIVRTIFDAENSHPNCQLVLGEVVNAAGKWSSYPPHHHPHPEIYHYRFTEPQGYGHAELGDQVYKVKSNDTLKILNNLDHAQCSAPGYGMYYAWAILHLPDLKYKTFEYTEEHTWMLGHKK